MLYGLQFYLIEKNPFFFSTENPFENETENLL